MDIWTAEISGICRQVLGNPAGDFELLVLAVSSVLAATLVLRLVAGMFKFTQAGTPRAAVIVAVSVAAALLSVAAVGLYVAPRMGSRVSLPALQVAAAAVVLLAVSVPVCSCLFSARYVRCLFTVLLSIAAAAAVVMMEQAAFEAFRAGSSHVEKSRGRLDAAERTLLK